jgi:hypothetical protein
LKIKLSENLGAEGDFDSYTALGLGEIIFTVTNTANDGPSVDGTTGDKRFIYPSYVIQSNDFLVTNTVYDMDSINTTANRKKQDAHTVLTTRYHIDPQYNPKGHYLAVCEGYSNTSAALLRAAGFETKYLSGYVNNSSSSHGWNHVYVNGAWKFYDATWDDPVRYSGTEDSGPTAPVSHKYFLLDSLTGMKDDHPVGTTKQGRTVSPVPQLPQQRGMPDGEGKTGTGQLCHLHKIRDRLSRLLRVIRVNTYFLLSLLSTMLRQQCCLNTKRAS